MGITIKGKGDTTKEVFDGEEVVGTLRKFCCGIDFRRKDKPNALFSILKVKYGQAGLLKCVKTLLSIPIPDRSFHWNFSLDTAEDKDRLAAYVENLNKPPEPKPKPQVIKKEKKRFAFKTQKV